MPYLRHLGADETTGSPVALEVLQRIDSRTQALVAGQAAAERRWRWQTIAAVAGALFAAVRLGVIAIPHVRARRARQLGEIGAPTINPRQRFFARAQSTPRRARLTSRRSRRP